MNPSAMSAPAIDRSADPIRGRGGPHRSLTVAPVAKPSGRFGFPDGEDDISPFTVLAAPSGFLRNVAGIALTVALAAILVWQLGRSDPAAALEAIPSSPAFLAVFALSYLAVPFAEFVIYRRLWRLPGRGFVQLLRKRVANDLLVSYSGEVWFYLWARTHLRTVRAPFADVKDVSVLSAMAANLVTLSMALVAAPFAVGLVTGPYRWPVVGSLTVTALVTLVVGLNRRKLLSAPARVLAWITKVHVVRIVASTGLVALCWHLAMPHVEMAVWLGLAVLRMLVSRLPLLPAKEAVFAAVAGMIAGLDAEVTRLVAATAISLARDRVAQVTTGERASVAPSDVLQTQRWSSAIGRQGDAASASRAPGPYSHAGATKPATARPAASSTALRPSRSRCAASAALSPRNSPSPAVILVARQRAQPCGCRQSSRWNIPCSRSSAPSSLHARSRAWKARSRHIGACPQWFGTTSIASRRPTAGASSSLRSSTASTCSGLTSWIEASRRRGRISVSCAPFIEARCRAANGGVRQQGACQTPAIVMLGVAGAGFMLYGRPDASDGRGRLNRRDFIVATTGGLASVAAGGSAAAAATATRRPDRGRVVELGVVASDRLLPRRVEVWLPPRYGRELEARYPVVYAQDGQNLFALHNAFGGQSWRFGETMTRLIAADAIRPAIVVGIWNTVDRAAEYMPQAAVAAPSISLNVGDLRLERAAIRSDRYLDFIARELKPRIDRAFRTAIGLSDTFAIGSSMGGLFSAYALARRPDVFGAAACLSTHWAAGDGVAVDWFRDNLPRADGTHRIYWDHGTETLDRLYAPYQARMDAAMPTLGYRRGVDWETRVFPGAEHSERAWAARLDVPLRFLLGRRS